MSAMSDLSMQRAFEQRTGATTLPIDLEEDLRSAFNVDPNTGEVVFGAEEAESTPEATDETP